MIIIADDYAEADGYIILSLAQAQERAKAHRRTKGKRTWPYTVADAMDAYLAWLENEEIDPQPPSRTHTIVTARSFVPSLVSYNGLR